MIDSYLLLIAGILLVLITSMDFFYTTLSFNGAGTVNKKVTAACSAFFLFLNRHTRSRWPLRFSGLVQILLSLGLWIMLLWLGVLFIMSSDSMIIIEASSKETATWIDRLYFSGYVLSTMGLGDFIPTDPLWKVVTAIFSFSGFIFLTTAISYLLNLASAVLHKRSLGLTISNLGSSPEEVLATLHSNESFSRLKQYASTLQHQINTHNQNHYAYPLSHYFYSTTRQESFALNLAILDEALTLLLTGIKTSGPMKEEVGPLRDAIDKFLLMMERSNVARPTAPNEVDLDLGLLKKEGLEVNLEATKQDALKKRRALMAGFLRSSGWNWKDIHNAEKT